MASSGPVREPNAPPFDEPPRYFACDRADALLEAIDSLLRATQSDELVERAALEVLSLTSAAGATVYLESPEAGPQLAHSGSIDGAAGGARAAVLRQIVAAAVAPPYMLLDDAGTLVVPFRMGAVRGGILVQRQGRPFGGPDRCALTAFAQLLGAAAAAVSLLDSLRQVECKQAALLDALGEGVLTVVEGRITSLNLAGGQLLSLDRKAALGASLQTTWPELARLLAIRERLDGEPLCIGGKELLLTLRRFQDGRRPAASVLVFTEGKHGAGRVRRAAGAEILFGFEDLLRCSAAFGAVRELALVAAQSDSSLVIEGESGVGKEVLAQAIHSSGARRGSPFVAVHCAAIPRELLESELFGYDPGAFTGANPHGHAGKFELADGGTLLLDDVVDMPLDMQAKLLRVLQDRSMTRLGGSRTRRVDVRIVATSNQPLRAAVEAGRFRSDLFYRLDVLHIVIPPLRERRDDIAPLSEHFLRKYSAAHGRRLRTLGAEALRALESYSWPGNVRELEHWIEHEIHFAAPDATCLERLIRPPATPAPPRRTPIVRPIREVERELFADALALAAGDISRAARELGISRGKLYRKLRLYGLYPAKRGRQLPSS